MKKGKKCICQKLERVIIAQKDWCPVNHRVMKPNSTKTDWEKETKQKLLEQLDFLSDHWVNGDDKPPFSFGGWREEVADEFIEIIRQTLLTERKKWMEEIDLGIRHLSGQWEAQTIEWIEGNKKAFSDILGFIKKKIL